MPGYRSTVQSDSRRAGAAVGTAQPGVPGGRNRLVWDVLAGALDGVEAQGHGPRVLDCGGGSGTFAVPLAHAGATVTVVDISADALATLRRRAEEAGVAESVVPVQADVEALSDALGDATFDLVLAHGVLEAVDSLPTAFDAIAAAVRNGGLLSVLVGNPVAAVLARALGGDLAGALTELHALDASFGPPGPAAVHALVRASGLLVEQVHGVGVFAELVPGSALDSPGAAEALARLEAETSGRSPFSDIAARVHVLARRPG
jgi:SAM-dependent methyltransferase